MGHVDAEHPGIDPRSLKILEPVTLMMISKIGSSPQFLCPRAIELSATQCSSRMHKGILCLFPDGLKQYLWVNMFLNEEYYI